MKTPRPVLFDIQYPATGCPEAAGQVVAHLRAAGLPAGIDQTRGLDHGAWVPLRQMFPEADLPVVPLSVQHHGGPQHAYRVGQALGANAYAIIKRSEFNAGKFVPLVSDDVRIDISIEAIAQ